MVGGISLIWAIPTNSAVLERYAHAGINERNASLGDSAVNGILARRIAVSELVNTHERVVDRIIRHLQGSHRQASGGVLPAPVPALGEQPQAAPAAAHPDGGQEDAIKGAVLSIQAHRGTILVGEWARARPSSAPAPAPPTHPLPADFGPLPAPLDPKMEAGGGGDRSPGPRRHRHLHHRPGAAQAVRGSRPPLRGDVQGKGKAFPPLVPRRDPAVGRRGAGWCRTSRPGNPSRCPAAPAVTLRWWTRTGFP